MLGKTQVTAWSLDLIISNHRGGLDGGKVPWDEVPELSRFKPGETALLPHADGVVTIVGPPMRRRQQFIIYYEVRGVSKHNHLARRTGYLVASEKITESRDRSFANALSLIPTTTTLIVREWRQAHEQKVGSE